MSGLRRVAISTTVATIGLIVMLGLKPISTTSTLAGYVVVLAAIAMAGMTAALQEARATSPSRFDAALARVKVGPSRPPDLVRAERELVLAAADENHFRRRLRPLLAEIAAARGKRVDLDVERPSMRDLRRMIDELEAS